VCSVAAYAMKVLRCHDMCEYALKIIFKSVVVAKTLYMPRLRGRASRQYQTNSELNRS